MKTFPCFCCNKMLNSSMRLDEHDPEDTIWKTGPSGGVAFIGAGNFGSTIYDPLMGPPHEQFEVFICDDCLNKNRSAVHIYEIKDPCTYLRVPPEEAREILNSANKKQP